MKLRYLFKLTNKRLNCINEYYMFVFFDRTTNNLGIIFQEKLLEN